MNIKEKILTDGYVILPNVFSEDELNSCKELILHHIKNNETIHNSGGPTIPDFIKIPSLEIVAGLRNNSTIQLALKEIFGTDNYRFCQHNDIGINRIVGWHKDKLNGIYEKYQTINIWSEHNGEKHEIVKVLIYLEDHSNDDTALKIVPKSHLVNNYRTDGWIQLMPKLGDVIIFDQRITHRGMDRQVPNPRILVSFGFGKNNIFTDNFERGTICRQNIQKGNLY